MTQGIFIYGSRPKSKKEIKLYVDRVYEPLHDKNETGELADPFGLVIEATSMFGNEYDGSLANMPTTQRITFVGPDPQTNRKFYGQITWNKKKDRWVVK